MKIYLQSPRSLISPLPLSFLGRGRARATSVAKTAVVQVEAGSDAMAEWRQLQGRVATACTYTSTIRRAHSQPNYISLSPSFSPSLWWSNDEAVGLAVRAGCYQAGSGGYKANNSEGYGEE